jgi:hypothetical protein
MLRHFKSSAARWSLSIGALSCFTIGYLLVSWGISANDPNDFDPIAGLARLIFGVIFCVTGTALAVISTAVWTTTLYQTYRR